MTRISANACRFAEVSPRAVPPLCMHPCPPSTPHPAGRAKADGLEPAAGGQARRFQWNYRIVKPLSLRTDRMHTGLGSGRIHPSTSTGFETARRRLHETFPDAEIAGTARGAPGACAGRRRAGGPRTRPRTTVPVLPEREVFSLQTPGSAGQRALVHFEVHLSRQVRARRPAERPDRFVAADGQMA